MRSRHPRGAPSWLPVQISSESPNRHFDNASVDYGHTGGPRGMVAASRGEEAIARFKATATVADGLRGGGPGMIMRRRPRRFGRRSEYRSCAEAPPTESACHAARPRIDRAIPQRSLETPRG